MSTETVLTHEQRVSIEGECHLRYASAREPLVKTAIELAEQAVLQSPEVQAWKRDAERLRYILDRVCMIQAASYGCNFEILNLPPHFGDCEPDPVPPFLSAIDAAMEKQP